MDSNQPDSATNLDERVSTALASLSSLFADCFLDVWTPLSPDARDRLAQLFDAAIANIGLDLGESGFGMGFIEFKSDKVAENFSITQKNFIQGTLRPREE